MRLSGSFLVFFSQENMDGSAKDYVTHAQSNRSFAPGLIGFDPGRTFIEDGHPYRPGEEDTTRNVFR